MQLRQRSLTTAAWSIPKRRSTNRISITDRLEWHRTVTAVTAEHQRQTIEALQNLVDEPVIAAESAAWGTVALSGLNWRITLAGAGDRCVEALAATGGTWCLSRAGRYGRFWWIQLYDDVDTLTILGSHLLVRIA